jgi:hypothetical protein
MTTDNLRESGTQEPDRVAILDNVDRFPTLRGWEPSVVPMPRRRKLAKPDPFFALEAQHRKLFEKLRPLEQANWRARKLPEDDHRRKKIQAAMEDIGFKIDRLEDQIFEWITNHPPSPAVLLACLNMFRDWVWLRREPMVDAVIASARSLLADPAKKGGAP